jgi:hypothetical protein
MEYVNGISEERIYELYDESLVVYGNGEYVAGELDLVKFAHLIIGEYVGTKENGMSMEAMKQALEALEEIHEGNMTPMAEEAWNKAITYLRKAIQEEALRNVQRIGQEMEQDNWHVYAKAGESAQDVIERERGDSAALLELHKKLKQKMEQDWSTQEAALESLREHMLRIKELEAQVEKVRNVHTIQTQEGCWDVSDYMCGLSNGLELAVSILEDREPQYKERIKQGTPGNRGCNCTDPTQCWEPCGGLGKSEEHTEVVKESDTSLLGIKK